MITDIALDLDGVIYPFDKEFYKFCSKALNTPLSMPTHWHFYEDWGLSFEEYSALLIEASHAGVFLHGEPPIGTHASLKVIREMGIKVHIITARPSQAWADTTWWLDHWMIQADGLHFTEDKTIFSYLVGEDSVGFMLEDSPSNIQRLQECSNIVPVVYDQSWNKDVDCLRVQTLMGFARLIDLYNKEMA